MKTKPGPVRRAWRQFVAWWGDHYRIDRVVPLVVIPQLLLAQRTYPALDLLGGVQSADRAGMYIGIAQVIGILVGFSIAALAFYQVEPGPRLRVLQRQSGPTIMRSWLSSIIGSMAVVGVLLIAALIEAGNNGPWMRWVAIGGLYFAAVRSTRLLWVFWQVLMVDEQDKTAPRGRPAPPVRRTRSGSSPGG